MSGIVRSFGATHNTQQPSWGYFSRRYLYV